MKKAVFFIFVIATVLSLSSCVGGGKRAEVSSSDDLYVGQLINKNVSNYDNDYGYKVRVKIYVNPVDTSDFESKYVWIQKTSFDRLPDPSDSVCVKIEYKRQTAGFKGTFYVYTGHQVILK